jgi:translocation and assembly module TamB
MTVAGGKAYGQTFESVTSSVRFEGTGVRLDTIQIVKGEGRGRGAAWVTFDGTYSFEVDARGLPLESVDLAPDQVRPPVTGLVDFRAGGSGAFANPRYEVHTTLRDLFVADEGIGQVIGDIAVTGRSLTLTLEAASPRLAISGAGRVSLSEGYDADVTFNVASTSLDPYLRLLRPGISPYTTAVASGTVHVTGGLADLNRVKMDATVDRLEMGLFDYPLTNAAPIRLTFGDRTVQVSQMRLIGQDTALDISGTASLADERIALELDGAANLGILQALVPNIRTRGRASLSSTVEGPFDSPAVSGTMTIEDGRLRHFGVPHALENVSGTIAFDSRVIQLGTLEGRLGGGPVTIGGTIGLEGARLGRLDVTLDGKDMRVRFPEGMRSVVDATLTLQGAADAASLAGQVTVRDAVYSQPLTTNGTLFGLQGESGGAVPDTPSVTTIPLSYDIRITAPSTLQVVNSTMRLVASADIRLQGTFDRPQIFGGADIERGEVRFEGRRYVVTRGAIDFNNPARIEPFLDIDAETRVRVPGENYVVSVRVSGPSSSPSVTFSSDPPLSDVEVLALLFSDVAPGRDVEFNRYSTDITPQQELLRERLARQLTGSLSSEVGKVVEQTFGVDTFQLTPSLGDPNVQSSRLDPSARLTIGKRLSDRVYLTYSRSLSSSMRDQIILLEIDQTDRSSWILSRNEDGTYAVDFQLRRTF